ncbi:Aste57867_9411 [Aphanomyces stellatus]|uniref:Aste57867_9411 protein n=1 Tax=Aphanomyces stellatus TaxID=120398 RepID=A0A485KN48_9STRA|nr:hypothetical protein As57867_009375 [Aphanomyces stellatus]VFT86291.1 Aste57867_9411 [Aphanomyces stellatus]
MNFSAAADEAISFLHDFHRVFGGPADFAPYDEAYISFLRKVILGCFFVGVLSFSLLLCIAGRRIMSVAMPASARATPSYASYTRMRRSANQGSNDIFAVILLGFTALSALGGLLAEAQVDYSVHRVSHSMHNVSHTFHSLHSIGYNVSAVATGVRANADDMLLSFNDTLPQNATQLSIEAMRLVHITRELANATSALPKDLKHMGNDWEEKYFWMKSSTNGIILTMTLSCFLAISAIGWSMSSTLRLAIFLILVVIPSSHGLFGIYLSKSIEAADFCVAPVANTLALFPNDTATFQFFVECPANTTLYGPTMAAFRASLADASATEAYLQSFAKTLPEETRKRLQVGYLDPIGDQLDSLASLATSFGVESACAPIAASHKDVVETWCTNGVLGLLTLWVHQVALCMMLFLSVIALVSVFEEVRAKEERVEMQYHLLSTYEEDNIEHLYMSPE